MEDHNEDAAILNVTAGLGNLTIVSVSENVSFPLLASGGDVPPQMDDDDQAASAEAGNSAPPPEVYLFDVGDELDIPIVYARLVRELDQLMKNTPEGCQVGLVCQELFEWEALISGPKDTPYEGGIFKILFHFTTNYPFLPPQVKFETKIYHSNISVEGKICYEAVEKIWTPVMSVAQILIVLRGLMVKPIIEEPITSTIAQLYKWNRMQHDANARSWTLRYAIPQPT